MLATQLRQQALLGRRQLRRRRKPAVQSLIRFPSAAAVYYTRGLRALIGVIRDGVEAELLPRLSMLLEQHNAARPDAIDERIDAAPKRIAIIGPPRAGKTTEALQLGKQLGLTVHHADDLIALGWSEASAELARRMRAADSGVFEGVAVVRAIRKLLIAHGEAPVDRVIVLSTPRLELTEGQRRMALGHDTVWKEIAPELSRRGVEFVFDPEPTPTPEPRTDAAGDDADELFARVAEYFARRINPGIIKVLVEQSAERTSNTNRAGVVRQIQQVVKIDVFSGDQGVAEHLEAFVSANVQSVLGLTDSAQRRLHGIVLQGARQGQRYDTVAKQIRAELQVSERRAANLARDQLGSLNAELTQLRQVGLGIKRYKWVTSRDERVRKSHRLLDGTTQEWGKPPIVNPATGERGHPGQPRRCRCTPTAVVEDLLVDAGLMDPADVKLGKVPPTLPQPLPANAGTAREKARTNPKPVLPQVPPPPLAGRARGANVHPGAPPKLPADVRPPAWMTEPQPHVTRNPADVIREKGQSEAEILTFKTPTGEKKGLWKPLDPNKPYRFGSEDSEAAAAALDRLLHGQRGAVVPPTVARELGGRRGSLQELVPNVLGSAKELTTEIAADPAAWAAPASTRKMFLDDVLTRNIDRHSENVLFTRDAAGAPVAHAIDNGYSFRTLGEHGKYDPRFAFPVERKEFVNALMDLDSASVATIRATSPANVAELLRAHGVEDGGIRETLVRLKSLQNDPAQLKALVGSTVEETQLNLSQWLGQSAEAHGLTPQELAELTKLAQGT